MNHAILLAAVLGASAPLAASALELTPSQTEGPYYPTRKPVETDADLTRIGPGPQAQGEVLALRGSIVDPDGKPIPGARIEIWQTDHQGIYMHPGDPRTASRDPAFQSYGETVSDAAGAFVFRTILPAAYSGRPRHIHAKITPPNGPTLTTQFYFKGDQELAGDGIARRLGAALERVTLAPVPATGSEGVSEATVTIVVKRGRG